MAIEPDTKDWTWVLDEPCAECGFDPAAVAVTDLPDLIEQNLRGWDGVLTGPDAAVRPAAHIWSPLEYGCHVRDVHRLFAERVRLMLDVDDPVFANWDQDVTAVEDRYGDQDPRVVADEMAVAAAAIAAVFADVHPEQWQRTGRRSNGSAFTVASLGAYYLHDVVHHLHDIGR
ncbi:MAG: DinB family protein [Propionibacteriales bacterium]|nr:DinB family protein [Propionibacteriales bacterium]